jgi:hypothetical protein
MTWLKRDGRTLGDPSKNPWRGDFVQTCIRKALPNKPLLGALACHRSAPPAMPADDEVERIPRIHQ